MRRIALLSGLVLVGGLLGPSTAFADDQQSQHNNKVDGQWIAVEDEFAFVLPNGETFTGEDPGPMDPNDVPPVGSQLFFSEVLYETEDGETKGDEVGRSHIQCTAQVVEFTFLCDAALVFGAENQLLISTHLDFGMEEGAESFDVAVIGGTGDWFGATGAVTISDLSTEEETASLYEADVVLPHD